MSKDHACPNCGHKFASSEGMAMLLKQQKRKTASMIYESYVSGLQMNITRKKITNWLASSTLILLLCAELSVLWLGTLPYNSPEELQMFNILQFIGTVTILCGIGLVSADQIYESKIQKKFKEDCPKEAKILWG